MPKNRKGSGLGRTVRLLLLGLANLVLIIAVILQGNNVALLNPKGAVANEQLNLMILTVGIMLIIAIPALFLLYFFAWKYRESNHKPKRDLKVRHTWRLDLVMWGTPFIFMLVLAGIMIPATHRLEPNKEIDAKADKLTIQVVSLSWKWLFIYPEQNIATVNYVQIPVDTPVEFHLTADESPMSSFWIPNLGGMLYAMTGHSNELNLIADTPGNYPGSTAEINGSGFSGMKFTANASSRDEFDKWVREVKRSPNVLYEAEYKKLLEPTEKHPVALYSAAKHDLYDTVLKKYMDHSGGHGH
jgi:cytochrome o ubiquinol oxidase subunit II